MADWTLTLYLDWEGGKRWGPHIKNQWRWCFTLEGQSFIQIHIQNRAGEVFYLTCDHEDLLWAESHTWFTMRPNGTYTTYAATRVIREGKITIESFHTMKCPEWALVDHINRDGLDNRRENLREGVGGVNQANMKMRKDNTSSVTGVSYCKTKKRWRARLEVQNTMRNAYFPGPDDKDSDAYRAAYAQRMAWAEEVGNRNGL